MRLGVDQRQTSGALPARSGRKVIAPTSLEVLEPRRLMSGHTLTATSCAHQPPAGVVAPLEVVVQRRLQRVPGAATREDHGDAPVALSPADQDTATAAASGLPPVERLGAGSHFSGYDYIPPDGSAPPPVVVLVDDNGVAVLSQVAPSAPPVVLSHRKIKPADRGLPPGPAEGPLVTPLAQTPSRQAPPTMPQPDVSVRPAHLQVTVAPQTTEAGSVRVLSSHAIVYLGGVAMAPPADVTVVGATVAAVDAEGLAYASNKATDALALMASADGLVGTPAYNFVHFNPTALLNDAMAAFSRESASLSFIPLPVHSPTRAWSITAAVIGLDLLLLGYCHRKNQRQKAVIAGGLRQAPRPPR